jgi:YidC/Oxa1 family membrane protein insertase
MAVRLLLLPLASYAFRGERARVRLAPQVQELYRQHGKHPERLQRELAALKAAEGRGMYAGCLPALVQLPFFSVVYRLFLSGTIGGSPNLLLRHRLLTVPLGSHWLTAVPWGLPLAAGLYLLTTTTWTLAERSFLNRHAPRLERGTPSASDA